MKPTVLRSFAAACCVAVICALWVWRDSFAGGLLKDEALLLALAKASMGRIQVAGQVVDEDGKPLNAVTVDIVRSSPVVVLSWTNPPSTLSSSATVNGTFSFTFETNCFVRLTFRKEGYLPEEKLLTIRLTEDQEYAVMKGDHVKTPVLTVRDLTITLLAGTGAAELVDYGAMIECSASGAGRVLDFGLPPDEALRNVENVQDVAQLPPHSLSLCCATNAGGRFRIVQVTTNALGAANLPAFLQTVTHSVPAQVRLVMTSGGDGFRPFETKNREGVFRQMRVAPATGYQRELVLDGRYFVSVADAEATLEDEELFFFCKIGKQYGKGVVRHVYLDGKPSGFSNAVPQSVSVGVHFRIQPDGSRNVGTEE